MHPTKVSDSPTRSFGAEPVEFDATDPRVIRKILESALAKHLWPTWQQTLQMIEAEERCVRCSRLTRPQ
jgi:hypothetical protein